MNYDDAIRRGNEILAAIRPFCHRAEIAGSVRRKKHTDIKDIEICAIPNNAKLFELRDVVNVRWGAPSMGAFPSKYCKIRSVYNIDFFFFDKETWGLGFFIRTGSADFAHRGLGHWKKVSNGGKSEGCKLYLPDGTHFPTPEEEDVFRALQCKFVAPERRQ